MVYYVRLALILKFIIHCLGRQKAVNEDGPMEHGATKNLSMSVLKDRLAVCRLAPDAPVPAWAITDQSFTSITRAKDELSIIIDEKCVPPGTRCEPGWRLLKVEGPFEFSLTGIVAAIGDPLRDAGVSILWVSTFDTDHLLVKNENLEKCIRALQMYGHRVQR
jgi:uncharacterized protein